MRKHSLIVNKRKWIEGVWKIVPKNSVQEKRDKRQKIKWKLKDIADKDIKETDRGARAPRIPTPRQVPPLKRCRSRLKSLFCFSATRDLKAVGPRRPRPRENARKRIVNKWKNRPRKIMTEAFLTNLFTQKTCNESLQTK